MTLLDSDSDFNCSQFESKLSNVSSTLTVVAASLGSPNQTVAVVVVAAVASAQPAKQTRNKNKAKSSN